jgi:hypothetical protein
MTTFSQFTMSITVNPYTLLISLYFSIGLPSLSAQNFLTFIKSEPTLDSLAQVMVQDTFVAHRLAAATQFNGLFFNLLQQKDAFKYPFERLKNISCHAPLDSAFRIYTWQVVGEKGKTTYYGMIQTKAKRPKVFRLQDKSSEIEEPEFATCSPDQWYGGLYYNMKEFKGKNGKQYLLFGYNQSPIYERIKFVDILTYRNGQFTFGAPLFVRKEKENRNRLMLTYGAEAKVRMNFDEASQQIIYDHLISTKHELLGMTMVPDGDFEGYRLEKGYWTYINDAVRTTPVSSPDRPFPVLDKRKGKNVFGKRN